ncbi:MAG: inorganic diphosphatase [Agriterribacter sp.]
MKNIIVVTETPKHSTEKYDYDPESHFFLLKKSLPQGMCFPYDFGFIPNTMGEDGDPLDVIILSEFTTFPGCTTSCRIIGCINAVQQESGSKKKIRNDRFVAIPEVSITFRRIKKISQLPEQMFKELNDFFINYNKIEGRKFSVLKLTGPEASVDIIRKSAN